MESRGSESDEKPLEEIGTTTMSCVVGEELEERIEDIAWEESSRYEHLNRSHVMRAALRRFVDQYDRHPGKFDVAELGDERKLWGMQDGE